MPVVQITLKFQLGAYVQLVPNFINIVVLATSQMTLLKK
jgi:hypothetical protein